MLEKPSYTGNDLVQSIEINKQTPSLVITIKNRRAVGEFRGKLQETLSHSYQPDRKSARQTGRPVYDNENPLKILLVGNMKWNQRFVLRNKFITADQVEDFKSATDDIFYTQLADKYLNVPLKATGKYTAQYANSVLQASPKRILRERDEQAITKALAEQSHHLTDLLEKGISGKTDMRALLTICNSLRSNAHELQTLEKEKESEDERELKFVASC